MKILTSCVSCLQALVFKAEKFFVARDLDLQVYPIRLYAQGTCDDKNHRCFGDIEGPLVSELNPRQTLGWKTRAKYPKSLYLEEIESTELLKEYIKDFVRYIHGEETFFDKQARVQYVEPQITVTSGTNNLTYEQLMTFLAPNTTTTTITTTNTTTIGNEIYITTDT